MCGESALHFLHFTPHDSKLLGNDISDIVYGICNPCFTDAKTSNLKHIEEKILDKFF